MKKPLTQPRSQDSRPPRVGENPGDEFRPDSTSSPTCYQALFSFRFENNIPAGKAKRKF